MQVVRRGTLNHPVSKAVLSPITHIKPLCTGNYKKCTKINTLILKMNKISVKIKTQQKKWNLNSKADTDENYVN